MNKLVAIVGMCGSGKSIASNYFEDLGYECIYFGGVTMEKLKEEGLDVTPENERMMREKLRSVHGMGAFALILLPKIKEALTNGNVVLDGLYSWEELNILKKEFSNLKVIAIVVNKDIRYERLSERSVRPFTYEEAKTRDVTEIENLSKAGPIAFADYYILNDGNMDKYYDKLDEITDLIEKEG